MLKQRINTTTRRAISIPIFITFILYSACIKKHTFNEKFYLHPCYTRIQAGSTPWVKKPWKKSNQRSWSRNYFYCLFLSSSLQLFLLLYYRQAKCLLFNPAHGIILMKNPSIINKGSVACKQNKTPLYFQLHKHPGFSAFQEGTNTAHKNIRICSWDI